MRTISVILYLCALVFAQPSIDDLLKNHSDQTQDQMEKPKKQEDLPPELQLPQVEDKNTVQIPQNQENDIFAEDKQELQKAPQEKQNETIASEASDSLQQAQEELESEKPLGAGSSAQSQEVPQIPNASEDIKEKQTQEIKKPDPSSNTPVNPDFLNQGKNLPKEQLQAINPQYLRDKIAQCEEKEDKNACFDVGMLFYQGRSVYGQKLQHALYFFDRSCDEKRGLGCYEAGIISANSRAYQHSFIFLEKSCQSGDLRGCKNLGILYYNGWGIPKNIYKATEIFNLGCKKGDKLSCQKLYLALGNAYQESRNYSGAKKHYRQACELGEAQACQKMEAIILLEQEAQRKNFR